MALRNYQYEQKPESQSRPNEVKTQPKYSNYKYEQHLELTKVKDVIFFAHLAFVSITSVILSFAMLALSISTYLAFPLAILMSYGLLKAIQAKSNKKGHAVVKTIGTTPAFESDLPDEAEIDLPIDLPQFQETPENASESSSVQNSPVKAQD